MTHEYRLDHPAQTVQGHLTTLPTTSLRKTQWKIFKGVQLITKRGASKTWCCCCCLQIACYLNNDRAGLKIRSKLVVPSTE